MRKLFLTLILCAACPPTSTPTPIPIPTPATCIGVCARAATFQCVWARPTAKGLTCAEVCNNLQNSGITQWDLACMANAASCAAMDACN